MNDWFMYDKGGFAGSGRRKGFSLSGSVGYAYFKCFDP